MRLNRVENLRLKRWQQTVNARMKGCYFGKLLFWVAILKQPSKTCFLLEPFACKSMAEWHLLAHNHRSETKECRHVPVNSWRPTAVIEWLQVFIRVILPHIENVKATITCGSYSISKNPPAFLGRDSKFPILGKFSTLTQRCPFWWEEMKTRV